MTDWSSWRLFPHIMCTSAELHGVSVCRRSPLRPPWDLRQWVWAPPPPLHGPAGSHRLHRLLLPDAIMCNDTQVSMKKSPVDYLLIQTTKQPIRLQHWVMENTQVCAFISSNFNWRLRQETKDEQKIYWKKTADDRMIIVTVWKSL